MNQSNPKQMILDAGIKINVRLWTPDPDIEHLKRPLLLLHGLSSNSRTWDQVAVRLARAGHPTAAIDQRGHGLSEKPDSGYDFETMTRDLKQVIENLEWELPVLAGQSWGGNVLLEFAARYPGAAAGYVFVDGGFLDLSERGPWEKSSIELKPPDLIGTPRSKIATRLRQMHPGWSEEGIEATLGNFEILPDHTIRPWLTLDRHMKILRSMYDQDPPTLFPRIQEPVLICIADDGSERMNNKREQVESAHKAIPESELLWFENSGHDIHVDRPDQLADAILDFI